MCSSTPRGTAYRTFLSLKKKLPRRLTCPAMLKRISLFHIIQQSMWKRNRVKLFCLQKDSRKSFKRVVYKKAGGVCDYRGNMSSWECILNKVLYCQKETIANHRHYDQTVFWIHLEICMYMQLATRSQCS